MFSEKNHLIFIVMLFFVLYSSLFSTTSNDKVILAEFDGGKITKSDLNEKIKVIPSMYQYKYQSPEGMIELLDQICIEELFYKEALALDIPNDKEVIKRIDNQIDAILAHEYRTDYLADKITFTQKEKEQYYVEHMDQFPDKSFVEAEKMIERNMSPDKEKQIIDSLIKEVSEKYNIVSVNEVIDAVNYEDIDKNGSLLGKYIIKSDNADLNLSVEDFIKLFKDHPKFSKVPIKDKEEFSNYIEDTKKTKIFAFKAKESGYEKKEDKIKYFAQVERSMFLRTAYNRLVIDQIDLTDEALKKHYNENIETFSSTAYRKIQQYLFDDEKIAEKILKKAKKAKKNAEKKAELIKENCKDTKEDGILPNIYKNDIIPRIGKDETYSKIVWSTVPGKFSEVFRNVNNDYVFFQVLEEHPAVPKPFEEVKDSIQKNKMKEESKKLFDELTMQFKEKYHLTKYPEKLIIKLTAEEYFKKAEESQKKRRFRDAIYYYDQVMKYYKNDKDDYKALFMKGFLLAEELKEREKAMEIFDELINNYPAGELYESAMYMKNELLGKNKAFEELEKKEQ